MPLDENPFADWSAHLLVADRTQYIIVSHTKSLYSTLLFGQDITNDSHFIERTLGSIREFLEADPAAMIGDRRIKAFLKVVRSVTYRKLLGNLARYDTTETGNARNADSE